MLFLVMWRGSKANNDADYHTEISAEVFEGWLFETVFAEMEELEIKCVHVLDRANYHTKLTDFSKPLVKSENKPLMAQKIDLWGGPKPE